MHKSYLNLLLVFFLFWSGCQEDDDGITASHFSNELLGTWELKDSTMDSWKYVIFTSENYFYWLLSYEQDRHYIIDGVFSVTGNQINMRGTLYIFSIREDTLTLSNPGQTLIFIRDNSAPTKDEWVIPVSVIKEIPLVGLTGVRDITFDGSNFWLSAGSAGVVKIDSSGNSIETYNTAYARGITFGNGNLWVSNYDSIKQVNPLNGDITSVQLVQGETFIVTLAYENGYIWGSNYGQLIKIIIGSGEIVYSFTFPADGIEILNNQIWATSGENIYCVDISSGKAIKTYKAPDYVGVLAFDGNNLWTIDVNDSGFYILQKLNIP